MLRYGKIWFLCLLALAQLVSRKDHDANDILDSASLLQISFVEKPRSLASETVPAEDTLYDHAKVIASVSDSASSSYNNTKKDKTDEDDEDAVVIASVFHAASKPQSHRDSKKKTHVSSQDFPLNRSLIPPLLLMTGKYESVDDFPPELKANLQRTLALTPGLHLNYMNDRGCREFLIQHADLQLIEYFDHEVHGSFKGDICRTAVLLLQGGFYIDLDFELHVPLHSLIDANTTLMTVYDSSQSILNALIAVRPNSTAMRLTMSEILKWYSEGSNGLLGPSATMRGILDMMQRTCPNESMARSSSAQWQCGMSENIRFYQEETIGMGDCKLAGPVVCPPQREESGFGGVKFAAFRIGRDSQERRLIGWPRLASCATNGCGYNGGAPSFLEHGSHRAMQFRPTARS